MEKSAPRFALVQLESLVLNGFTTETKMDTEKTAIVEKNVLFQTIILRLHLNFSRTLYFLAKSWFGIRNSTKVTLSNFFENEVTMIFESQNVFQLETLRNILPLTKSQRPNFTNTWDVFFALKGISSPSFLEDLFMAAKKKSLQRIKRLHIHIRQFCGASWHKTMGSEKFSPPCERNIDGKKLYISNPIY